ncbi:hypothetical protein K490DRAFT_51246 [Saccharata proteae CBS 121410]|uniref:AhpC/TSA antioxidant enzyme-domain-containing protein n=1 Tax=Saccharata proteae CBS 121410 TaxID=1314787 RepID=A0A9P4HL57_9PEZI|nr:hypothetical protein K490DRAFT_51246 [Saccharata proteae CBS 121410]
MSFRQLRLRRPSTASDQHTSPTSSTHSASTYLSESTVPTSIPSISDYSDDACAFDTNDYFAELRADVDVSDDCPSRSVLNGAGDHLIYDGQGNSRTFKSLYDGDAVIGERQLVLFVRHFFCGACQAYLKALTESITPQTYFTMPIQTSISIVGCGSPKLIAHYKKMTGCPFPIYADPTRKLYKSLGMSWSLNIGTKRPEYMSEIAPPAWLAGQLKQVGTVEKKKRGQGFRGGNWLQIGGEFLFEDGDVIWCHRMKNYRDHTEITVLRRLLEVDD